MGWNSQNITTLLIVTATGGFTGLFVYAGPPAAGNLMASIAASGGTDPYGNTYIAGVTAYLPANPHVFAQLFQGILTLSTNLAAAADQWQLSADSISGTTYLAIETVLPNPSLFIAPSGLVIAAHPGAAGTPESLQVPTTTGFGTVAGAQQVKYEFDAFGNVEITGAMVASGAYTAGTTIWTVAAGYRPAAIASVGVTIDTGGAFTAAIAQVDTSGNVSIPINVAAAAEVFFNGGHYRTAA